MKDEAVCAGAGVESGLRGRGAARRHRSGRRRIWFYREVSMKRFLAAAALLLGSAAASAATIEVGTGDWSNIPEMRQIVDSIDSNTVAAIHETIESGECVIEGQRKGDLDMTVPFLVQFAADGN